MEIRRVLRKVLLFSILFIMLLPGSLYGSQDKCGTCYEIFVYSFYDSDGDGIGDLPGVLEKLDYINDGDPASGDDLGCDMIWLSPVFASPTYHKYDVTDYLSLDEQYTTSQFTGQKQEELFRNLTDSCHERGIKLILDLPLNHTSTEHPWFQKALQYLKDHSAGTQPDLNECPEAGYYLFSDEPKTGYAGAEGSEWYYEARFWSGMPDLNLDNEAVRSNIAQITKYWIDRGVDGFRLDAVTSYYTDNKEKNIEFLHWLNETVKEQKPDAYLVGEAWTDPDTYAAYYSSGIDSLFDFAFAGQEGYIAALARGKRDAAWYGQKLMEEEALFASYSDKAVNAPFYTNHDMARSAGYYTRDDGSRTKLAQALNLLMPGNAFLYYGEELGMKGSGRDENKRAPMYWSEDPHAEGMCSGPPEMEEVSMKFAPFEDQKDDPDSIYCYVRKAIRLRNTYPAIACGKTGMIEALSGEEVCAVERKAQGTDPVLLIFNLSEEAVKTELSVSPQAGEYTVLSDMLCVGEEQASLEGSELTLPPFGIAVLTLQ